MLTTSALRSPTNKLENWNIYLFFFFNIPYDLPGSLQCLEPCYCSCSTSPPAWMFAGDLTVIRLGRLISNLIIPLINVWCLGALAGVTITSVRPPETVKQTPAKPESRSQAKTLPVSSGLWTGKQPPLHWDFLCGRLGKLTCNTGARGNSEENKSSW